MYNNNNQNFTTMTHQEFLNRVKDNLKVDENYYNKFVEPLYMMSNRDKDFFCEEFNKFGRLMVNKEDSIFDDFAMYYRTSEQYESKLRAEIAGLEEEIKRLQQIMIANGLENETLLPTRELIKRKLEMGFEVAPALTIEQLNYIKDNLQ